MSDYQLEPGANFWRLPCKCCGKEKNRVMGLVYKDGGAHAKYYALLNVGEERPRVGLTLSVGPWGDGSDPSERSYVYPDVRSENDGTHIGVRDPTQSNHYPWGIGGLPLTPEQAKVSRAMQEILSVADFIVDTDRAISSYLNGSGVNAEGREVRQGRHPASSC
jgi:hypothetical protein